VAAGTLLPENTRIPPRSLVMGTPGRVRRTLTEEDVVSIRDYAERYVGYRLDYMSGASAASAR
jgi:carbonic anhydrase/acetyltransferase-like protein (isoleucine patch superfamily)